MAVVESDQNGNKEAETTNTPEANNTQNTAAGMTNQEENGTTYSFPVTLDGSQTVPPTNSEATGFAELTLEENGNAVDYFLQLNGLDLKANPANRTEPDDVTKAHLHSAEPGTNGQHVLNIFGEPSQDDDDLKVDFQNDRLRGSWEDSDAINPETGEPFNQESEETTKFLSDFQDELLEGELYAAVHTNEFPGDRSEIRGQIVDRVIEGDEQNNVLSGGSEPDVISGGEGKDNLSGGEGNDIISGDEGNDILTGGSGSDEFRYAAGAGDDFITDFDFTDFGDTDVVSFGAGLLSESSATSDAFYQESGGTAATGATSDQIARFFDAGNSVEVTLGNPGEFNEVEVFENSTVRFLLNDGGSVTFQADLAQERLAFSELPSGKSEDAEAGDVLVLGDANVGNDALDAQAQVFGTGNVASADAATALVSLVNDTETNLDFLA